MDIAKLIVGVILPYVALAVFLAGMTWRIRSWKKLPSPPMTLFPAPPTEGANTIHTIKEALFFPSLFRNDRLLWALAWGFHAVLALIFVGHFRVFTGMIDAILIPIIGADGVQAMSTGAGSAAGILVLVLVAGLFIRRLMLPRVDEITAAVDYFALLLIAVVVITGNLMRLGGEQLHINLDLTRVYFLDLAMFRAGTGAEALQNNAFVLHMFLALVLIMLIPFSKILHFGGIFFTHQLVRKN